MAGRVESGKPNPEVCKPILERKASIFHNPTVFKPQRSHPPSSQWRTEKHNQREQRQRGQEFHQRWQRCGHNDGGRGTRSLGAQKLVEVGWEGKQEKRSVIRQRT